MGLLDQLAGQATSALSGIGSGGHPGLMNEVTQMLGANGGNGLQALLAQFQGKGLGDAVASWVGTGHNLPITAEQLHSVLGNAQVAAIAQKLGISPTDAASHLASVLPQVVNHLTPNGHVPSGDVVQQGLAMLKSLGIGA